LPAPTAIVRKIKPHIGKSSLVRKFSAMGKMGIFPVKR
jgi:hypothetical protein